MHANTVKYTFMLDAANSHANTHTHIKYFGSPAVQSDTGEPNYDEVIKPPLVLNYHTLYLQVTRTLLIKCCLKNQSLNTCVCAGERAPKVPSGRRRSLNNGRCGNKWQLQDNDTLKFPSFPKMLLSESL